MNIIKKEVLLLKSQNDEENDKYEILRKNNFTVKYLQILDFEYINTIDLNNKLNSSDNYDGIIFTSPRAILSTKISLRDKLLNVEWHSKDNYVVGETTYDLALKELGINCNGKDSGNANNLADLIINNCKGNCKKYLFPCGNLKKETLETNLKEHNISLDAITVYKTVCNPNIKLDFKTMSCDYTTIPEYVVFFSPSGVKFTADIFKKLNLDVDDLKFIAIGPSTEKALKNERFFVHAVAKKPTEQELVNAILKK